MSYWLMKSEPDAFSIDDLAARPRPEPWDGVRNYQARNMMRDQMRLGDQVFFYHSNCDEPGIVGVAEVASEAYPDQTAFDPEAKYYDPKSDPDLAEPDQFPIHADPRRNIAASVFGGTGESYDPPRGWRSIPAKRWWIPSSTR